MSNSLLLLHTSITVLGIVGLIVGARLNPVIVLVLGSLYLGLATGLGFEGTAKAVTTGFGDLMAEVGLIIGFGVLLGSLLSATGTLQRIVELFLKAFGKDRSPYALGLSAGVVFPAIYFDVALVMLAPIAKSVASRTGIGIAKVGGALAIGLEVGLLMVLPGAAALAGAGALQVPLGTMLLFGLPVGVVAIIGGIFLHGKLMDRTWRPDKDEAPLNGGMDGMAVAEAETPRRHLPLIVTLLPVLVPLALIVVGTIAETSGAHGGFVNKPNAVNTVDRKSVV